MLRSTPLLVLATLLLTGCSSLPFLGGDDEVRLPGERKPVILANAGAVPDDRIAGLTVTVPPAVARSAWTQLGGSPSGATGNVAGPSSFNRAWSRSIGTGSSDESPLLAPPVVADGRIFAVDAEGWVTALSAGGEVAWSRELHEDAPDRLAGGGIGFGGGRVYVTLGTGEVVALSAAGGEELWRADLRTPLRAAPGVAEGRVLVRSVDNQLLTLDAASGAVLWSHSGLFEPAAILGGAPPAATRDTVVVAYSSGEVFGLVASSGQPVWSESVLRPRRGLAAGTISDITAAPVIDGDRVYVAGVGGEIAAFDWTRGVRQWEAEIASLDTPWIAGEFIYLISEQGELVCLLRQGGRVRWVTPIAATAGIEQDRTPIVWSGPIMVEGRLVLVGTDGMILAFSPTTGELIDRAELGSGARLSPVAAGGAIYVLTDDGEIVAFR